MSLLGMSSGSGGGLLGGDIWSTGAFSFESPLKDLLDSGTYTLEQLLAEDELLQELRGLHPKLLDFFSSEEAVTKLVQYAISVPQPYAGGGGAPTVASTSLSLTSSNADGSNNNNVNNSSINKWEDPEFRAIRFPYMACEVICCEVSCIIDTLVDGHVVHSSKATATSNSNNATTDQGEKRTADDDDKKKQEEEDICSSSNAAASSPPSSPPRKHHIINDSFDSVEVVDNSSNNHSNNNNSNPSSPTQNMTATTAITSSSSSPSSSIRILDLLFSLLYSEPGTLDDYRAGYFEKILRILFKKRPDDLQAYVNCTCTVATATTTCDDGTAKVDDGDSHNKEKKDLLQRAMLSHLYSHSILQIVQRLLLPHRPHPKKQQQQTVLASAEDEDDDQDENQNSNIATTTDSGSFGNSQQQQAASSLLLLEGSIDDDLEDDDDDDPQAGEIKSDWSKSPAALELLLDHLMVVKDSSNKGDMSSSNSNSDERMDEEKEQRRLDLSLNAAEVLITMIQNSMLSSTTMLTLTTSRVVERLVRAASTLGDSDEKELEECYFSPHESFVTSAMSVLESLILQLGGYGAVGTMSLLLETSASDTNSNNNNATSSSHNNDNGPDDTVVAHVDDEDLDHAAVIADLTALLEHLPTLLDNLARLLQHPSCAEWKTVTQFSKDVPQPMLGSSRLRIVRVLESLVLLGDPEVDARLVQSDCLELCLNLFWDFQWCSMLHQSVANLLVHVLEGQNLRVEMQEYFLIRCNLLVRLMDSFVDPSTTNTTNASCSAEASTTTSLPVVSGKTVVASDAAATTAAADRLPVSEDDVDAVLEKQQELDRAAAGGGGGVPEFTGAVSTTATAGTTTPSPSMTASSLLLSPPPPQSFRYGYMGHVIIICQALVHACSINDDPAASGTVAGAGTTVTTNTSNDADGSSSSSPLPRQVDNSAGGDQLMGNSDGNDGVLGNMIASSSSATRSSNRCDNESIDFSREPLFLAEMVACHPLSDKWSEFVSTTLASETTIQSTPLGGYNAAAATDGMMMMQQLSRHRPGLTDDSDELGLEPPSRMGDVLDMDDNDLEIAASMMAGLAVTARGVHGLVDNAGVVVVADDDAESGNSGDSDETNKSGGGYDFDDPLGRLNGGLGLELGKLTKYNPGKDSPEDLLNDAGGCDSKDDEDDDDASSTSSHSSRSSDRSSSSEEQDRRESESDVPVMDLFAGNFDFDGPSSSSNPAELLGDTAGQDWSNFANFDDAFAAMSPSSPPPQQQPETAAQVDENDDDFKPFEGAALGLGTFDEKTALDVAFVVADSVALLASSDETATEKTAPGLASSSSTKDSATNREAAAESSSGTTAESLPLPGFSDDASKAAIDDPARDDEEIVAAPSDELNADLHVKLSAANGEEEVEQVPAGEEIQQQQAANS